MHQNQGIHRASRSMSPDFYPLKKGFGKENQPNGPYCVSCVADVDDCWSTKQRHRNVRKTDRPDAQNTIRRLLATWLQTFRLKGCWEKKNPPTQNDPLKATLTITDLCTAQ